MDLSRHLGVFIKSKSSVLQFIRSRVKSLQNSSLIHHRYTSLGSMAKTKRNPALLKSDGTYSPAHMLQDETKERDGR